MPLPLPQFQASRPEAVGSNVVNVGPRVSANFWGTVVPNLAQAASTIRTMVEGNPGVESQNEINETNRIEQYRKDTANTDNPELWQQQHDQEYLRMKESGRYSDEQLEQFKNQKPLFNTEQQFKRGIYDRTIKNEKDTAAYRARNDTPAGALPPSAPGEQPAEWVHRDPFSTGPDMLKDVDREHSPDNSYQAPPPQASGATGNEMDGMGKPAARHLLQDVSDHLHELGAPVTPDNIHANQQNGVVVAVRAVGQGQIPLEPSLMFPLPLPGTANPAQLQAAQTVAAQDTVPKLREILASQYGLNAMIAASKGKELDAETRFGMLLDDEQANQLYADSMYKLGAGKPVMTLDDAYSLARLAADPGQANSILAKDGPDGIYQQAQDRFLHATPAEQVHMWEMVKGLATNTHNAALLQFKADSAKQKLEADRLRQKQIEAKNFQDTQFKILQLAETARGHDLAAQSSANRLAFDQQQAANKAPEQEAQRQKALMDVQKNFQAYKEKEVGSLLKRYGLPDSGDQESVRARQGMEASQKALAAEQKNLRGMEAILRGYRDKTNGIAEVVAQLSGDKKVDQTQPGWEKAALQRLQDQIKESKAKLGELEGQSKSTTDTFNQRAGATAAGLPTPATYVRRFADAEWKLAPGGVVPSTPEPNSHFVQILNDFYRNSDVQRPTGRMDPTTKRLAIDPKTGKPETVSGKVFDLVKDSNDYVKMWGGQWNLPPEKGGFTDTERKLLLEAFNTYSNHHRKGKK